MSLSGVNLKTILKAGFLVGPSDKWIPKMLDMLSRPIEVKNEDDQVVLYHIGDFALPERNATAINFEQVGGWTQTLTGLDTWSKGLLIRERDKSRLPELEAKARQLPNLFARAMDDGVMLRLVEGDNTTYGKVPDGVTAAGISFFSGTGVGHVFPGNVNYKTAQFNLLQAAEVGTSLSDPNPAASPTADQFRAALDATWQYICSHIKDSAGNNLFTGSEPFDLLLPTNLDKVARSAFEALTVTTGGENVYTSMLNGGKIIADSRLTDTAVWYIAVHPTGSMERPIWHPYRNVDGQRYNFAFTDQTSDEYVSDASRPQKFSVVSQESLVYGDWRLMYRVVFS